MHYSMNETRKMPSLKLWVKQEPFTIGCIPLLPHAVLTLKHLKRIVTYVKDKEEFPFLRYSTWKHIACNKLQMSKDLAHLYFENYNLIHMKKADDRAALDMKIATCKNSAECEHIWNEVEIDTRRFALLLFLQNIYKEKFCPSFLQEEWFSKSCSSAFIKDETEIKHLNFVKNKLGEMLYILKEDDNLHEDIPESAVASLDLIIEGSNDNNRTILSVYDLALMKEIYKDAGYTKVTKTFKHGTFISWIKTHLGPSPFGLSACIYNGCRLNWCDPGVPDDQFQSTCYKRSRLVTNAATAARGKKLVYISQVRRQTLARTSATLHGSTVKLNRCQHAYFYLLSPLRSLSVEQCHDLTLIVGPVASIVEVFGCRNLKISVVTRRITVRDSSGITLFLLTPTRPLILGDKNASISFAPYNVVYPTLEQQMTAAGVSEKTNFWDQPYSLVSKMKEEYVGDLTMPPKEFVTYSVPFEMDGPTKEIPGGLPSAYENMLKTRQNRIQEWHAHVNKLCMSNEQRDQLHAACQQQFQTWLAMCGYQKELNSLSQYQKDYSEIIKKKGQK